MVRKGPQWLAFALILIICLILVATLLAGFMNQSDWCNKSLKFGDCQRFKSEQSCYCIEKYIINQSKDGIALLVDTFDLMQLRCMVHSGTLVAPVNQYLLSWLAERLHSMDVGKAVIGLRKISKQWTWMQISDMDIPWNNGIEPPPQDTYAVIRVEAAEDGDEWYYGLTSSDSVNEHGIHYICEYRNEPLKSTTSNQSLFTMNQLDIDWCFCEINKVIDLSQLEESETISSPGYPDHYCVDLECGWTVRTQPGLVVKLEWSAFTTEDQFDMLHIYDGETNQDMLIDMWEIKARGKDLICNFRCTGSHCGDQQSLGHAIHIDFLSDHVTTDIGFKARFTAVKDDVCYCSHLATIALTNAGESYSLYSPNYPKSYCPNLRCSWSVTAPPDFGIEIIWNGFSLEPKTSKKVVNEDAVFIYSGNSEKRENLLKTCIGSVCDSVVSFGASLLITFISDGHSSGHEGFAGVLTVVPNSCEKAIMDPDAAQTTSISYSAERADGNIPMGSTAIVECSSDSKINGTKDAKSDYLVCDAPLTWKLMLVGGYDPVLGMAGVELYFPLQSQSHTIDVDLIRSDALAAYMDDGKLLVLGGDKGLIQDIDGGTVIVNLDTGVIKEGPQTTHRHFDAVLVTYNHSVVLCGGSIERTDTDTCEVYKDGKWDQFAKMHQARGTHTMVVANGFLFAIGGTFTKDTMKGILWIGLGLLTFILLVVFAFTFIIKEEEWCSELLSAGECLRSPVDHTCYCVNEKEANNGSGLFEQAQSQCNALNGTLATPSYGELLIWLSKSMYSLGFDKALIGLLRIGEQWFWIHPDGKQAAHEILWRPDFGFNYQHKHAMISVETRKSEYGDDYRENYIYYNYDHYLEMDSTYQWFGFVTSDNNRSSDDLKSIHHICHYIERPSISNPNGSNQTNKVEENGEDDDSCYCNNNEHVKLVELGDSYTLTSPRYPKNYCSDNNCRWFVTTQYRLALKLDWAVFHTESPFDIVRIYDGHKPQSPLLSECTGSKCYDQMSTGHEMQIHFSSDHVTTSLGFKAVVTAVESDSCQCSQRSVVNLFSLGDAHILYSPNHPNAYCMNHNCGWTFSTTNAQHALQIVWQQFQLEESDFVGIFDGESSQSPLLANCTNDQCPATLSSSQHLHVTLVSDSHQSQHKGFIAVVTVVPNHCDIKDLVAVQGSVSYSAQLPDGKIPVKATATITCDQNSKVINTVDDSHDTAACEALRWTKELRCVSVCELSTVPFDHSGVAQICKVEEVSDKHLVADGHIVRVGKHYITTGANKQVDQVFKCTKSKWSPATPHCHTSTGILLVGGHSSLTTEIYSPIEQKSYMLPISLGVTTPKYPMVMTMSETEILLVGGVIKNDSSSGASYSEILNLQSGKFTPGPYLVSNRHWAAVGVLNTQIFICGGYSLNYEVVFGNCEYLTQNGWMQTTYGLITARSKAQMVSLGNHLYIIGGDRANGHYLRSVEKLSPNLQVSHPVAPMRVRRDKVGAATLNGYIFACGGEVLSLIDIGTCERYDRIKNSWSDVARMKMGRERCNLIALEGKLYVLGGHGERALNDQQRRTVEVYNEKLDKWNVLKGKIKEFRGQTTPLLSPLLII